MSSSLTATPTTTITATPTASVTATPSPSLTPSTSLTATPTASLSGTGTPSTSLSASRSPSASGTTSPPPSPSPSTTLSPGASPPPPPSVSPSPSHTPTPLAATVSLTASAGAYTGTLGEYVRGETFLLDVEVAVEAVSHPGANLHISHSAPVTAVALVDLASPDHALVSSCGSLSSVLQGFVPTTGNLGLCDLEAPGASRDVPATLTATFAVATSPEHVGSDGVDVVVTFSSASATTVGTLVVSLVEATVTSSAVSHGGRPTPLDAGSVMTFSTTITAASGLPTFDVLLTDATVASGVAVLEAAAVNNVDVEVTPEQAFILGDVASGTSVDVRYSLRLTGRAVTGTPFAATPCVSWAATPGGSPQPSCLPLSSSVAVTIDKPSVVMTTDQVMPPVGLPAVAPGDAVTFILSVALPEGTLPPFHLLLQQELFAQLVAFDTIELEYVPPGVALGAFCTGSLLTAASSDATTTSADLCGCENQDTDDGVAEVVVLTVTGSLLANEYVQPGTIVTPQTVLTPALVDFTPVREWHTLLTYLVPANFVDTGALDLGFTLDGVNTGEEYNISLTLCDPGTQNFTAPTQDVTLQVIVPSATVTLTTVFVSGGATNYTTALLEGLPAANLSDASLAGVFSGLVDVLSVSLPSLDAGNCTHVAAAASVAPGTSPASVPHGVGLEFFTSPGQSGTTAARPASSASIVEFVPVVCDAAHSCAGHGVCHPHGTAAPDLGGSCQCVTGWRGPSCCECDTAAPAGEQCNGSGVCNSDGTCTCVQGFTADAFCRPDGLCSDVPGACDVPPACVRECVVSEWGPFGECSEPCGVGGGVWSRNRTVLEEASWAAAPCPATVDTGECNTGPCPVDCTLGPWTPFSPCTAACGGGNQTRARGVAVEAAFGGAPCGGAVEETQACNTQRCLTASEEAAQRAEDAVTFEACDRSEVQFAIAVEVPGDSSTNQVVANSVAATVGAVAMGAAWYGVGCGRHRAGLAPASWAAGGGPASQALHRNWRNMVALVVVVVESVQLAAPAFAPGIPWLTYVPVKALARAVSLSAVRSVGAWVALEAAFGVMVVFVCVMLRVHGKAVAAAKGGLGRRRSLVGAGPRSGPKPAPPVVTLAGGQDDALAAGDLDAADASLPLHLTTSIVAYTAGTFCVVPALTIFLQAFTCGFPFGTWQRSAATQECTRVECWGGAHLTLAAVSGALIAGLAYVSTVGLATRCHQDQIVTPGLPPNLCRLRAKALELQPQPGAVLAWAAVRFAVVYAGLVGTRVSVGGGAVGAAVVLTAAAGAAFKWDVFVSPRHRALPRLAASMAALTAWLLVAIHFLVDTSAVDAADVAAGTADSLVTNSDAPYDGDPVVMGAAGVWVAAAVACVVVYAAHQRAAWGGQPFWVSHDGRVQPRRRSVPDRDTRVAAMQAGGGVVRGGPRRVLPPPAPLSSASQDVVEEIMAGVGVTPLRAGLMGSPKASWMRRGRERTESASPPPPAEAGSVVQPFGSG